MNLEEQVVSIELAKKLKELGVKQNSLIKWAEYPHLMQTDPITLETKCIETIVEILGTSYWRKDEIDKWSAFTVAELGELLPKEVNGYFFTQLPSTKDSWIIFYRDSFRSLNVNGKKIETEDHKEADARAKMLIHLIEEGIVEV